MSASNKVLIIHNPIAGHGRSAKILPQVKERLTQSGIDFRVMVTERRGHAEELAKAADFDGFGIVASMGGDGTLSEVVNGLMVRFGGSIPRDLKVAVIPSGTGNDLLGGSGLPLEWENWVDVLRYPVTRPVDVFRVTDSGGFSRYAVNCFGIGFDAYVTRRVTQLGTAKIGPLSYMVEALRGLLHFDPRPCTVSPEGLPSQRHEKMWLLGVVNSKQYGGGMRICPGARFDDGLLNYALLRDIPRRDLVRLVFLVRSGKHVGKPGVELGSAPRVRLDAPEGFPCHVDGDTVDVKYPVTVEALQGALPLVVGPRH